MYSGVIGRYYRTTGFAKQLTEKKFTSVILSNPQETIEISIIDFQHWIDCKHQMYVRQVGEVTLPFPDEDC